MKSMPIYRFKICIFGDGGVGKTTLVNRCLTGVFKDDMVMTLGMEFFVKKLTISNVRVSLQIWDFAGQRQFKALLPSNVSNASGGLFMYDITRYLTVKNLNEWITIFKKNNNAIGKVPIVLVGGKLDLKEYRSISKETGFEIAKKNDFFKFIECSSVTGENVDEIFITLAREILKTKGLIE